jgi:hypothetical protein
MIENFFGLVNSSGRHHTPSPDLNLSGDLDTLLTSIEATREILRSRHEPTRSAESRGEPVSPDARRVDVTG